MASPKSIYFASDFHLGIPDYANSREREQKIVAWLDAVAPTASKIFLLGDVFDFWFEYKKVIPKGFVRLQGKIAALTDQGIEVYMFKGNHDMWIFDYFQRELGVQVISDELTFEYAGSRFFLHHGDGLGDGDYGYKFVKRIFRNPVCIWLFSKIPSRLGMGLAHYLSSKSRLANKAQDEVYNPETEWLLHYCEQTNAKGAYDYMIFGHRHLPLDVELKAGGRYINLGEWMHHKTYAVYDGTRLELKKFE